MTIRLGIIGLGHWGPNYVRLFSSMDQASVVACADLDVSRHAKLKQLYPHIQFTTDPKELIQSQQIDALILATPTVTHYDLARMALQNKKHLLVEKPLTIHSQEAFELARVADQNACLLMVGHTFLYNPAVQALREMIQRGDLGQIRYFSTVRTNLGPIRQDVNALWDLAPHDISILLHLLGQMPERVSASGAGYLNPKIEDVSFITLHFPQSILAQIHVSWLEPVKVRRLTVIGDKKMAVFNDIDVMEPIRIFDKGVTMEQRPYANFQEFQMVIREGDVVIPKIPFAEPLQKQCVAFLDAVAHRKTPLSDAQLGARVVQVLEAAMKSIHTGGQPVTLLSPTV
jgi:predicted dehydrogenase